MNSFAVVGHEFDEETYDTAAWQIASDAVEHEREQDERKLQEGSGATAPLAEEIMTPQLLINWQKKPSICMVLQHHTQFFQCLPMVHSALEQLRAVYVVCPASIIAAIASRADRSSRLPRIGRDTLDDVINMVNSETRSSVCVESVWSSGQKLGDAIESTASDVVVLRLVRSTVTVAAVSKPVSSDPAYECYAIIDH